MSPVCPRGLRVPPAIFHDHGHRPLRGAGGRFVFVAFFLQAALDDFFFGECRNFLVTRPMQWPGVQWETLPVKRAAFINPPDLYLQQSGDLPGGSLVKYSGIVGKRRCRDVSAKAEC